MVQIWCRFLMALYTTDAVLEGSGVSQAFEVRSNNDATHGAANMKIEMPIDAGWDGWDTGKLSQEKMPMQPAIMHVNLAGSMQLLMEVHLYLLPPMKR